MPTGVCVYEDGSAHLMCIFHEYEAGAMFPLPADKRPEGWPDIPREELNQLMILGSQEAAEREDREDVLAEQEAKE